MYNVCVCARTCVGLCTCARVVFLMMHAALAHQQAHPRVWPRPTRRPPALRQATGGAGQARQ